MEKPQPIVITDELKEQILLIRDTGRSNMFDVTTVHDIATELGYDALAAFLANRNNHKAYHSFILTGNRETIDNSFV